MSLESEIEVKISNLSCHMNESQMVPSLKVFSVLCIVEIYRSLLASINAIFLSKVC